MIKKLINIALLLCFMGGSVFAQGLNKEVFNVINLEHKGLEKVKELHEKGDDKAAAAALLDYYRNRTGIQHPDIDLSKVKSYSDIDKKYADDALEHKFFAHKGYQPSYFYGEDINWKYWPVQDNELRWQLHRHKWFSSLGRVYYVTKDEKYAKAWADQYMDWIKKNPLIDRKKIDYDNPASSEDIENVRFAWRPLEVSHRLQDQPGQMMFFINSPSFTPEFLTEFLVNYDKHGNHILKNYSDRGNHLLFEAQRMIYAGAFFPELKDAETWRKSGIDVLNREVVKQVYDDGMQYELDPHYHLACIQIFYKALQMADANGFRNEFPASYIETIHKMIEVEYNLSFPDYSNPLFGDAKKNKKDEMIKSYRSWLKVFPKDKQIQYFASEGKKGELPSYTSAAFKTSGFYVLRNGWDKNSTAMIYKAGPPAFWHNQPDNGTFELWIKGRSFFPDAGSYVYAGDEEVMKLRNWFRQTMVHKTLTLDNKDIEETNSKLLAWNDKGNVEYVWTENPSYKDLKHKRAVFFVDKKFYVIVDEAVGTANGKVGVHYQVAPGKHDLNKETATFKTLFKDNNNIVLQSFSDDKFVTVEEEGWVSPDYRKREKRLAFALETQKTTDKPVRYISVILPVEDAAKAPKISASFLSKKYNENEVAVEVKIGKEKYKLSIQK